MRWPQLDSARFAQQLLLILFEKLCDLRDWLTLFLLLIDAYDVHQIVTSAFAGRRNALSRILQERFHSPLWLIRVRNP